RGLPRRVRVLLGLRRRRAGQQAVRERRLRRHAHVVLHADAGRADRSHPRGLRAPRAKLDSATGRRGRCSITEAAMIRSTLFATTALAAALALATAYAQAPPAGGQPPPQNMQGDVPTGPQGGPPPSGPRPYGEQPNNAANEG